MFKLESYITPIILSYVDKYIKNFRPEDSQVSLWGGDASFHNLDLRLEVLEQELQLPFSFVSGHIHELLIHVPWTKLASEPITITINTIECILKLRGTESSGTPDAKDASHAKERDRRKISRRQHVTEAPPGYVQFLVNKIVSNIRIYCNNLILKYVEEDIVLSMNVKLLSFESANEKWEPAYTDLSLAQVIMRKIITVNDLTVCLDKRNASGKIDVYQEPMLYRCSMVIHLLRNYHSATSKRASTTRLDISCNQMEFSMTEQQIPMLLRLIFLLHALHQKELKSDIDVFQDDDFTGDDADMHEKKQTLAGWAWSFVPTIQFNVDEEWLKEEQIANLGHTTHIGFYVDTAALTFKVSESRNELSSYYAHKKVKYWPLLTFRLDGIFTDFVMHGQQWVQCSMGICQMLLLPLGNCSCSQMDVIEDGPVVEYLKAGALTTEHKSESLFDAQAVENKGQKKLYNVNWDEHIAATSEAALLERSPAFAIDYLYQLDVPDDMTSEALSEFGSDLEYSNLSERSLLRMVVGPLRFRLCSGLIHRLGSLQAAASTYDYMPYSIPPPDPDFRDLQPPSSDDYDALNENIPTRVVQLTVLAPVIEFQLMDHPYFKATKDNLFRKRKKISTSTNQPSISQSVVDLPKITLECQCIDLRISNPMYIKRLVRTTCQLPEPPEAMFDACHSSLELKVISFCSRLILSGRQITIVTPASLSFRRRKIISPQYWIDSDIIHDEINAESESITLTGTNPKILIVAQIIDKLVKADCEDSNNYIINSSLLQDATRDFGLVYLEFCMEGFSFKKVVTNSTVSIDGSLGAIKAFIFEPIDIPYPRSAGSNSSMPHKSTSSSSFYSTREIQQVLFISGPEFKDDYQCDNREQEEPLFTFTLQFPLHPEKQTHPPICLFSLQEIRVCIDPLLCRWLLYTPKNLPPKTEVIYENIQRKLSRSLSDVSLTENTPKKSRVPQESIHSSSDHRTFIPSKTPMLAVKEEYNVDLQEKIYNFLKKWFDVWKGLLLYGDISQCTIYFPVKSLSAVGSQGIQQAVHEVMKKENPPDILVFTMPFATIRSTVNRNSLLKHVHTLPVSLPEHVWTKNKESFPWSITVSDLSCYTWQHGKNYNCLAPVALTATVGLSTKNTKDAEEQVKMDANIEQCSKKAKAKGQLKGKREPSPVRVPKKDIGSLGICVHIDMTPILISTSEVQVCLIASILHGLIEVLSNLTPDQSPDFIVPFEVIPVMQHDSTLSPTLLKDSTLDSTSESVPRVVTEKMETDNVKLTAWVQWTITRFSIELLAHDSSEMHGKDFIYTHKPKLKLIIDAEDIVSSLDFQSVYLKIKSKIGAASIQHFIRTESIGKWKPGEYLGFVMRAREESSPPDRQEDTSFANITITRASCQHTHNLWGQIKKNKSKDTESSSELNQIPSRYITEIVLNLQPIDLLICPSILRSYFMVLEPLMQIPTLSSKPARVATNSVQVSNRTLPLTYLEFHGFRIIMPSINMHNKWYLHDVCMFQVEGINLTPTAVNPICRTPCRPDIYQQAAQSRILNIPGSDVEDRQYQLDIMGISMNTGKWSEISQLIKAHGNSTQNLKTMSENPALEWNSLGKSRVNLSPSITLWPIISKFDISIVAAPSMIYKNDVICGHSIEINFTSDIKFTISLTQIKLIFSLIHECSYVSSLLVHDKTANKRPKVVFPYPKFNLAQYDFNEEVENEFMDNSRDSGFETSDLRSINSTKTRDTYLRKISESERSGYGLQKITDNTVPLDILITGGKFSVTLYEYEKMVNEASDAKSKKQSSDKEKLIFSNIKSPMLTKTFDNLGKTKGKADIPVTGHGSTVTDEKEEVGYEGSEEGSVEELERPRQQEKKTLKKFDPLLYVSMSQPNMFVSCTQIGKKMQLTCYDVGIKISDHNQKTIKEIPTEDDFPINLLETKSGAPYTDTGVLPAFFTLKWSKSIGKPATLDLEIAKPTRILVSVSRWNYFIDMHDKIVHNFRDSSTISDKVRMQLVDTQPRKIAQKTTDVYSKFREIKEHFYGISTFNVKLAQFVLSINTEHKIELTLSVAHLNNNLVISNRPERLTNTIKFHCITLGLTKGDSTKLLLNPWTAQVEVCLFWEAWQSSNSNPQLQVSIESDCIMLDMSPDQLNYIDILRKELAMFIEKLPEPRHPPSSARRGSVKTPISEKEQHYKDDLRAGAFQFVDSTNNNIDELPMPYQVMFWNRNISAMAWRYPQPRALTKVRIFPVPFKMTTGNQEDQQILCHLEYWSDCHGCYQPYTEFYLSETDMCHLELPKSYPQPAVACTWRVVLTTPNFKDYNQSRVFISPRALAGCIRVDSYFNKTLIPDLTVALHVSTISINLYNNFNKKLPFDLPDYLKAYTPDLLVPENQRFLSLNIDNANAYLATWNFEMAVFDINATTKCFILDYGYLTSQMLIEPFTSKLEISFSKTMGINFISKPIHFIFGASAAHTLMVSAQIWDNCITLKEADENTRQEFIIMTNYIVCNDTNVHLRFGQAGFEDIFLPSRYCHLYAWRSQKCKQMLRVALEENQWVWSEPFRIDKDGTEMCKIADESIVIVVTVKSLSATQKQVTFSGEFSLCNTLLEHFEMKIIGNYENDREREFKNALSHIVRGRSTPPSVLIDATKKYYLRLRFFGLESAWSGDIPLMENTKCAQPWLVKVPLQERGQFLSIWCRIIVQDFPKGRKILAIFWPLFMVRSNLPTSAKVHIETPTLNVHLESTIRGLGEYQQLYCPGTIDHSHQLTFQLDSGNPSSNPYVPLNYSLVDQKQFFKKLENEDINEVLSVINNYDKAYWPYFKDDIKDIEFNAEEQPLTHVQVRYQNACQYSSALLVELLPWSLLVNTLGCSIAIIINEKELCRIGHHGIITPPKLEETFYIGVGIGGTWNMSTPLQLAKSDWGKTFYMPKITGTIPLEGTTKTVVKCDPYVCMVSINSTVVNEIRLLKLSSTHVLTSHLNMPLQVICFAVPENETSLNIPVHFEKHCFTVGSHLHKSNMGISIVQWYVLGKNMDSNAEYALYIAFSSSYKLGWSCPVRVDKNLIRRSIVVDSEHCSVPLVLVSQDYKGQIYLSVHHDLHPQLLVENQSGTKIHCAQSGGDKLAIVKDSEHFNWLCTIHDGKSSFYNMPILSEKFPELPQNNYAENLVFASDPEGDPQGFQWSSPVSVTSFNDQFVRLPFYGDVKVSVKYSVHTIHVIIESVSQVEISARDIRVRLSLHESESNEKLAKNEHSLENVFETGQTVATPSTFYSAESVVSDNMQNKYATPMYQLPALVERTYGTHRDNAFFDDGPPSLQDWTSIRVLVFLKGITITLTSDLENGGAERIEVASLTFDNISLTMTRAEMSQICLSISDIQMDNQLFSKGSYDFPVILVGQEPRQNFELNTFNVPIIQLVQRNQHDCLVKMELNVETWKDLVLQQNITAVRDVNIQIQSLSAFIEDVYIMKLMEYLSVLSPTKLVVWPENKKKRSYNFHAISVAIPEVLIWQSQVISKPLLLKTFSIEPLSVLLSIHSSIKMYIALDQSPLHFKKFERRRLFTTSYRLGHSLTMHYLSGAMFGAGWVVGSLELLGSPGGLARAMGTGLRDFVTLPCNGLLHGPWAFLYGITQGSASLMKHVTAGTLQSVTKLASSVARNLDRMTLDEEHLKRAEEARRQRPQGLTEGLMQGLTGFGISLLGAVGGIAHHPLQSVMSDNASTKTVVQGVGKGLVGVFTKPLSGAAELVALTGQGILQGAGWNNLPIPRHSPVSNHIFSSPNSNIKYSWKFIQACSQSNILFVTEATSITNISNYDAVALILTTEALVIVDTDEDMSQRVLSISELSGIESSDPTLLCLKLEPPKVQIKVDNENDLVVEMDPACRARVADYVRSTVGLMQLPDTLTPEHSEMSISPDLTPSTSSPVNSANEHTMLTFYVNPLNRNYFLCLLALAKQQSLNYNFPVL